MENCLFCKIIAGEIPSACVYQDEKTYAFRDIAPQAPAHILVVPKAHITSAAELEGESLALAAHMLGVIPGIAKQEGLENGWRIVSNVGDDGGQTVKHLHFHLLGGKKLSDKMG